MREHSLLKTLALIKRIRVRKLEKKTGSKNTGFKFNMYIKSKDETHFDRSILPSLNINRKKDLNDNNSSFIDDIEKEIKVEKNKKNLVSFDHEVTDFEYKLKYLNLKDLHGNEFGSFFPSLKQRLVIFDDSGKKFSIVKVGANQISGDLLSFFKYNDIKPGDIISIEYDNDELANDGKHIVHVKTQK